LAAHQSILSDRGRPGRLRKHCIAHAGKMPALQIARNCNLVKPDALDQILLRPGFLKPSFDPAQQQNARIG
jgi:hypothetical protein